MAAHAGGFFRTTAAGRRLMFVLLSILVLHVVLVIYFTPIVPRLARQSAVRAMHSTELRGIAQAMEIYTTQFGVGPSLDVLAARGELPPELRWDFARVVYPESTSRPSRQLLIAERVPLRAVRQGESWGGPGETAQQDYPAVRTVLWSDGAVEQMEESVFQRDFAPFVTFTPLP